MKNGIGRVNMPLLPSPYIIYKENKVKPNSHTHTLTHSHWVPFSPTLLNIKLYAINVTVNCRHTNVHNLSLVSSQLQFRVLMTRTTGMNYLQLWNYGKYYFFTHVANLLTSIWTNVITLNFMPTIYVRCLAYYSVS